jgi:hypothetical protein
MKSEKELKKLTKLQLDEFGRTIGIELDRRLKKDTLIKHLLEHISANPDISGKKPTFMEKVIKAIRIILWPLITLKNILNGNWWAEKIGNKTGIYDMAAESRIRSWALGLTGWKYWAYQIGGGLIFVIIIEFILNSLGLTMLPWG